MFASGDLQDLKLRLTGYTKPGDVYSEPIAKFHRGHNPHPDLPYLCIGVCVTAPDREHVTNALSRPW